MRLPTTNLRHEKHLQWPASQCICRGQAQKVHLRSVPLAYMVSLSEEKGQHHDIKKRPDGILSDLEA